MASRVHEQNGVVSFRRRTNVSKLLVGLCAAIFAASLTGACANTVQGAKKDTEKVVEKTAGATNTVDVKTALIADGRVDASNINVDTSTSTKTVVLKGTVPTEQQKTTAEAIARDKAEGYTISNLLTVAPAKAK
jgi:osmotically-inducible protein OsmY